MPLSLGIGLGLAQAGRGAAPAVPADAGPNSPGTLSGTGWTNPSNAASNNNSFATVAGSGPPGTKTNYLLASNFGFSIPATATILAVRMEIEFVDGSGNDGQLTDCQLLKAGVASGSVKTGNVNSAGTGYATAGNLTNDLWGATLTPADVNHSGFGVQVRFEDISGEGYSFSVDHIRLTVHYED